MKTIISYLIAVITALGLCPLTARIIELNRTDDIVTIETATGHQYKFFGCEDYCEGDYVSAILWRNGTDTVKDDVILSVLFSGYADYAGDTLE